MCARCRVASFEGTSLPTSGRLRQLRTDLPIHYCMLAARQLQIPQRKQRRQLRGVLLQSAVAHRHAPEQDEVGFGRADSEIRE